MNDEIATPGRDPGDLSRRIAERRRALGLSVGEVASRAGMDPIYLDHVERDADARPSAAACARLAVVLQTSVNWLRGGGVDLPPGHGRADFGSPVLEALGSAECFTLIRAGGIGRVVFNDADRPAALPVNFAVLDQEVVFRTGEGAVVATVRSGGPLSFEVDNFDEVLAEGWSVLISGRSVVVRDPVELHELEQLHLEPWAGGDRHLMVRITPETVSGRRIRHPHGDPA